MKLGQKPTRDEIAHWFEKVLAVFQKATLGESDFYQKAAEAVVELIGLDEGIVLLAKSEEWSVVASTSVVAPATEAFCKTILKKVIKDKRSHIESQPLAGEENSRDQKAFVAAPIVDLSDNVVGLLIGARRSNSEQRAVGIDHLEALVLQLLAGVISSGLIGEDRQAEASRFQMQLEQFASPGLVSAMKDDPNILDAREREITVLFSDIRGFTGLTERVGAEKTFQMIRNLMNQLTRCILDEDGFIMGYAGDGIAAMWNGLADQPDHSELACWAAINMQSVMAKLSEFWHFVTGEKLEARIGISTGLAHVGNAGSRWRMNYTVLGPCVNLASRLEGANKFFGTSILINQTTKDSLFSRFSLRRIGPVLVMGLNHVEQVFELRAASDNRPKEWLDTYELALKLFEQGDFQQAYTEIAKAKDHLGQWDTAMTVLKSQIESFRDGQQQGSPAIKLMAK